MHQVYTEKRALLGLCYTRGLTRWDLWELQEAGKGDMLNMFRRKYRGKWLEMGRRVIAGHTPDRELIEGTFSGRVQRKLPSYELYEL